MDTRLSPNTTISKNAFPSRNYGITEWVELCSLHTPWLALYTRYLHHISQSLARVTPALVVTQLTTFILLCLHIHRHILSLSIFMLSQFPAPPQPPDTVPNGLAVEVAALITLAG